MTSTAFALGTGIAFLVAYLIVARGIRDRNDAWLSGETELLSEVVDTTSPGGMHAKLVEEVAELARHEVMPVIGRSDFSEQPVFFYVPAAGDQPDLWVGPSHRELFLTAIRRERFEPGAPRSIDVAGFGHPFRVNVHRGRNGGTVYLGFLDESALTALRDMRNTFIQLWLGMLAFGILVSWIGARRILKRVDEITEAASRVGADDLQRRVPEAGGADEISRLAHTFNRMLDRIEVSVEQIRTLGDGLAHDIRSPLTSIRGNLELALSRGNAEDLREAIALGLERIDRLLGMLNTSLDVAEAEAGALKVQRRETDLREIAADMVALYQPLAEERGLTLEVQGAERAVAAVDPELIRRALANLLDNAIQYLPAGRRVTISAESRQDHLALIVTDDGEGFPKDIRDHAFDRFVKSPSSKGFGIGLSLVRAAALAHGGEARILDAPGGGARIEITLPSRLNKS